jgi:hypothetical protein
MCFSTFSWFAVLFLLLLHLKLYLEQFYILDCLNGNVAKKRINNNATPERKDCKQIDGTLSKNESKE